MLKLIILDYYMKIAPYLLFVVVSLSTIATTLSAETNFPERPVHIVVYTDPGGLIDVTARRLAAIMEKKINQPVVVENKKGGGGIVALSHVLRRPADGYTIFGLTSSVISKAVAARQDPQLDKLHMLALVVSDYECLITHKDSGLSSVDALVTAAKEKKQIWVGPAFGGTDHLFAMRTWNTLGINATWVPYRSGNQAVAALLGKHGDVYVGNPQDVSGQPDLRVLAVAAPGRLKQYPEVPTFTELGYPALSDESLWRGFAVKAGTPDTVIAEIELLLQSATTDPEWLAFIQSGNMIPAFDTGDNFRKIVSNQIEKDKMYLNLQ